MQHEERGYATQLLWQKCKNMTLPPLFGRIWTANKYFASNGALPSQYPEDRIDQTFPPPKTPIAAALARVHPKTPGSLQDKRPPFKSLSFTTK